MTDFLLNDDNGRENQRDGGKTSESWKVLVVDDDKFVHEMTQYVLNDVEFDGRPLRIISAYSAAEARLALRAETDIAVVLLDVIMETETAGLDLIPFIRRELKNNMMQIVIRTGQAGQLNEREIVTKYEINDYKSKSDLTSQKLYTSLICGLRTFRNIYQFELANKIYNEAK